jgi:hypothetical protein
MHPLLKRREEHEVTEDCGRKGEETINIPIVNLAEL